MVFNQKVPDRKFLSLPCKSSRLHRGVNFTARPGRNYSPACPACPATASGRPDQVRGEDSDEDHQPEILVVQEGAQAAWGFPVAD